MHSVPRKRLDIAERAPVPAQPSVSQEPFDDSDLAEIDVIDGNRAKRRRVALTSAIALVILGIGYGINMLLGGAEVTVFPKQRNVSVQADFSAYTAPTAGQLGYELLTLEAEGEKQVKANGKESATERAQGKIFVYNTKSGISQRLIKNTRFESKDGLIYRIKESIEIPGAKQDAKGNLVPGSIVTDVFADGPGEQYNIEPGRFTVPGLKGTEQFDSIYGESTTAFTGGFEGEKYIIDETELSTAKQALHIELRDKLLTRLKEERPAGFVAYDSAVAFTFEPLPSTEYGDSLATIKEKAVLKVPMFNEAELSKFLAENTIPDYTGDPVRIIDPQTVAFAYESATTTVSDIGTLTSIDFMLKGNALIVWNYDEDKLKNELLGLNKTESTKVFSSYPSIETAETKLSPFWTQTFPDSPDDIEVSTVIDKKK
jgi:hypothetical protein